MLLLLALLACDPDGFPTAGPPPPQVTLSADRMVGGWPAVITVQAAGAGAGRDIVVAASRSYSRRTTCPSWLRGTCHELVEPFVLGRGVTDASGSAQITVIPGDLYESELQLQAILDLRLVSDVLRAPIQHPTDDDDEDGLEATVELELSLDPWVSDSDGGGISDGQEWWTDHTDPHTPGDDRPGQRLCTPEDHDADGLAGCEDPDCQGSPRCWENACDDQYDDDADGLIDCADPDCPRFGQCGEVACTNGADDDADGLIDCQDDDCWTPACHTEVVAWVEHGTLRAYISGTPTRFSLSTLSGRVWVNGPATGPRVCAWTFDSYSSRLAREELLVETDCQLTSGFLPDLSTLIPDPRFGWLTPGGALLAGPFQPLAAGSTVATVDPVLDADPIGSCAGGAPPTLAYLDADGDGYGVSDRTDLLGAPGDRVWVCDLTLPGLTTQGGDCHGGDPSHNPAQVVLAPGAGCADLTPDDQDGDGVPRALDADDHNAQVR
jgi:hypothetical protein